MNKQNDMDNTPETDAELHAIKAVCKDEYMLDTMAEFARKLERERDEVREALASREVVIAQHSVITDLILERDKWAKLCGQYKQERDEARAAIPDGEWVAYEDHKKVHDAASRLLVAINKQLPIGSFSLISHEYHALKDAIYGKEGAK
jgi:hypothetical protein